jgi:hypothetical protein
MTLEAWVNPTAWPGSGVATVMIKYIDGTSVGESCYALSASASGVGDGVTTDTTGMWTGGMQSPPLNAWTHLAVTYDGATLTLLFNGQPQNSVALTGAIMTSVQPLFIGGDPTYGNFFSGMIDEIRIYDRALSQAEIQSDIVASSPN